MKILFLSVDIVENSIRYFTPELEFHISIQQSLLKVVNTVSTKQ